MPRAHTILNSASNSDPIPCGFVVRDTFIKSVLEADLIQVEAEIHLSFGGCIRESKKTPLRLKSSGKVGVPSLAPQYSSYVFQGWSILKWELCP